MELEEVTSQEDLYALYKEKNIDCSSIKDRIAFLRRELGVTAIRGADSNEEGDLYALEEIALLQLWDREAVRKKESA